ncbi:MAG: DNA-formamidopyrimidine glycosylase family protein [Acidimicrobiales bacterium]
MPELVEVEFYRRLAEDALHRPIISVVAPDPWFLKGGVSASALRRLMVGASFGSARRVGKLLLMDLGPARSCSGRTGPTPASDPGPVVVTIGIRFGMTGRLVLDGRAGVDRLIYAPRQARPQWERFAVGLAGGGRLAVSDPRRLGGIELNPNEARLGPDAAAVTLPALRHALGHSHVALKARIMDQQRLAGIGNLMADEVLWRAGLSPLRPTHSLSPAETKSLHRHLRRTVTDLLERGGSHLGDVIDHRGVGMTCPRDGAEMVRAVVGGRTTWFCPRHQN